MAATPTSIEQFIVRQWNANKDSDSSFWWQRTANIIHGASTFALEYGVCSCLDSIDEMLCQAYEQALARRDLAMSREPVVTIGT